MRISDNATIIRDSKRLDHKHDPTQESFRTKILEQKLDTVNK